MIVLFVLIVASGCVPPPVPSDFPYPCSGIFKDQSLSEEVVLKVRQAHEKWLKNPKDPEGRKANFCGAKLSHRKFQEANLESAIFQMAMLAGANFTGAMLNEAQLQGANLSGTNFSSAHLSRADLDHAMLHLALFQNTDFHKTTLRHAMLSKTTFKESDLTDVIGLTQSQINMACVDGDTKLPKGLNRPEPCLDNMPK